MNVHSNAFDDLIGFIKGRSDILREREKERRNEREMYFLCTCGCMICLKNL